MKYICIVLPQTKRFRQTVVIFKGLMLHKCVGADLLLRSADDQVESA